MTLTHFPSPLSKSFSEAVSVPSQGGTWIMVSGQVGVSYAGSPNTMDFVEEVRTCFDRIRETLVKSHATMAHVVKLQAYLTDLAFYGDFSCIRAEVFSERPPASSVVQVSGLLLNARVEVDAIAFVPDAVP